MSQMTWIAATILEARERLHVMKDYYLLSTTIWSLGYLAAPLVAQRSNVITTIRKATCSPTSSRASTDCSDDASSSILHSLLGYCDPDATARLSEVLGNPSMEPSLGAEIPSD